MKYSLSGQAPFLAFVPRARRVQLSHPTSATSEVAQEGSEVGRVA